MEEIRNDDFLEKEEDDFIDDEIIEEFDFDEDEEPETEETKTSVFGKIKNFVGSIPEKASKVSRWIGNNPDEAAAIGTGVLSAIGLGALGIAAHSGKKKQERTVYSDEIKDTIELKKKLKNKDKVELDYRVKTGQSKIEALDDMGFIKK